LSRRGDFPAQNDEKMTTTASVSKRSRRCKNGYRNMSRSLVAPKSGMVSEIGGNTVITFVPGNVGWPRKGQRNRGNWAPTPAATGPSERRGRGRDPGRPPSASRARPHHASRETKPHLSLSISISFPAQSFESRSKRRLAPVHHILIRPIISFCFVMAGDAAAMVDNNTPYFGTTWRFSRPK
jgi:hypothetical protein